MLDVFRINASKTPENFMFILVLFDIYFESFTNSLVDILRNAKLYEMYKIIFKYSSYNRILLVDVKKLKHIYKKTNNKRNTFVNLRNLCHFHSFIVIAAGEINALEKYILQRITK